MAISIDWGTQVISVPQADLTFLSGSTYELDIDVFRLALKDLEDSEEGMAFPTTHNHVTPITVGGVTLARVIEIINGYTITFQDVGSPYAVNLVGANSNIADVTNINNVSVRSANSAGLVVSGSGVTAGDKTDIANAVWVRVLEGAFTAEELMRILIAVAAGDASGLEGASPLFKSIDGLKTRVAAAYSGGTRTVSTRDGS